MVRQSDPGGDVPIDPHARQFFLSEVAFLSRLPTSSIRNWRVRGIVGIGLQNPVTGRFRYSITDALKLRIMQSLSATSMAFNPRDAAKLASMAVPLAHASTAPGQQPCSILIGWEADGGHGRHGPARRDSVSPASRTRRSRHSPAAAQRVVCLPVTAMLIDLVLRTQRLHRSMQRLLRMSDLDGPITLTEACAATGLTAETIRFATAEEPFNGPMTLRKVFGGTTVLRLLSMLLPEQAVALGMTAADGVQLGSSRLLALGWTARYRAAPGLADCTTSP